MGIRGRTTRYIGSFNPSTITGIGQRAFGTLWPAKKTVVASGKGKRITKKLREFSGGDIWPNPSSCVASKESKCFNSPKSLGS